MKDSEILRDLISLAFDSNPADTNIALRDCLDLLGRTIVAENAGGCAEIVAKKHSLVTGQTPTTSAAGRVKADTDDICGGEGYQGPEEPEEKPTFNAVGVGAAEKREIYSRLSDYRSRNGLGCLAAVAKATNGVVTEAEIRAMLAGDKYPLAKWKIVGSALDYVDGEE